MPKVTINGQEHEVPAGLNAIQAAAHVGVHIPHFCWHEKLKVDGNCRMCLIELKPGPPKLQIACNTIVAEGMTITSDSERVKQARRGVMELLLLNHPLDCPVCDKAYECRLQDYTYAYGTSRSRWEEAGLHANKRTYTRKDFGDKMFVEMNRCIECTRCVRVLKDVCGEDELGRVRRGHNLEIGSFKEKFESPFQLNAVDVCPVGALGDKKYRFTTRVWDMYHRPAVCSGCSVGCAIDVWSYHGKVRRFTPRDNPFVNSTWLCDAGRWSFDSVNDEHRPGAPLTADAKGNLDDTDWESAFTRAVTGLAGVREKHGAGAVGFLFAPTLTNEELFAGRMLAQAWGASVFGFVPGKNARPYKPVNSDILPRTLVSDDKTPNSRGAALAGLPADIGGKDLVTALVAAIEDKKAPLRALVVFGENVLDLARNGARVGPERARIERALASLDLLVVADLAPNATGERATVFLPTASHLEKAGSFTNWNDHVQVFRPAFAAEGGSPKPELEIIWRLGRGVRDDFPAPDPERWFDLLAADVEAFRGLSHESLGALGRPLFGRDPAANAAGGAA